MDSYSRGATQRKSSNSKLMFSSVCNARGRCGWCFIPNWVAAHFLAFQVADSSEWQVELFARNSASQTARARYAHTHTLLFFLFFFKGRARGGITRKSLPYKSPMKSNLQGVTLRCLTLRSKWIGYFGPPFDWKRINVVLSNLAPCLEDPKTDC